MIDSDKAEAHRKAVRKWRAKNPERAKELGKENDEKRKGQRNAWRRSYYQLNKDIILAKRKVYDLTKPKHRSPENRHAEYVRNKDTYDNWKIKNTFGIDINDYNKMLNNQNGVCEICGNSETARTSITNSAPRRLSIDHDHSTGKIRGLLCRACNHLIGNSLEDEEILFKAVEYIRKHRRVS